MPKVSLKHKNEHFESLLRRWKKAVEKAEILKTLREKEYFICNGEKRKRAAAAARKREERRMQEFNWVRLGIKPQTKKNKRSQKDQNED